MHLAGITINPTGDWTNQAARSFLVGFGRELRFVIHESAGHYASAFDAVFEAGRDRCHQTAESADGRRARGTLGAHPSP